MRYVLVASYFPFILWSLWKVSVICLRRLWDLLLSATLLTEDEDSFHSSKGMPCPSSDVAKSPQIQRWFNTESLNFFLNSKYFTFEFHCHAFPKRFLG